MQSLATEHKEQCG